MSRFIKVLNTHIEGRKGYLTVKELYVLSYLKYQSDGRSTFRFRMSDFLNFVNSKSDTYVQFSGKVAKSRVSKLKDKRSLAPILNSLVEQGLIETDEGLDFCSINANSLINITLLVRESDSTSFESISYNLIEDLFPELGYNGFGLFCFLKKNHRVDITSGGSCSYSVEDIAKYLGVSEKTVMAYTALLVKLKLIKFTSSYAENNVERKKAEREDRLAEYKSNYYKVYCKYDKDNKYYVNHL